MVLAKAGALKGKNATYSETPAAFREMKIGGAVLVNKPVVVDGKIITANGPPASKKFAAAIVKALTVPEW